MTIPTITQYAAIPTVQQWEEETVRRMVAAHSTNPDDHAALLTTIFGENA